MQSLIKQVILGINYATQALHPLQAARPAQHGVDFVHASPAQRPVQPESPGQAELIEDFTSPTRQYRPDFRYWLPDANVSSHQVKNDIEEIDKVGAGGLEFLAYYNYGQYIRADVDAKLLPGNWSAYGVGSDLFNNLLSEALKTAVDKGLMFDIPLGGSQGQGVPAEYQSTGLLKELIRGSIQVEAGTTYNGTLPSPDSTTSGYNGYTRLFTATWGAPNFEFKAAVGAQLTGQTEDIGSGNFETTLRAGSLVDLTSDVTDGRISWTPPKNSSKDEPWVLFAFYERFTDMRNILVPEGATTWMANGSWVVDHFSVAGAKKSTDFFDNYVFNKNGIRELLPKAHGLTWEDSSEFPSVLYWTPGFPNKFKKSRKYDMTTYLPILHSGECSWTTPYTINYVLDPSSDRTTDMVRSDFLLVLNEGYLEYLDHLDSWSTEYGLKRSSQPAYGLPINMAKAVPHVAVPELESLAFGSSIINYKLFTGAAHIAGQNVISTEVGAINEGTYELTVPRLKAQFQGSFAAGVNRMVLHGFPYGGDYYDATWPGFTAFHYEYTEMYGPRQPQWRHFNDLMSFTARNQLVLQTGVPKLDLTFLFTSDRFSGVYLPDAGEYTATGFSYEFIDPDNLLSTNVSESDKTLDPDGPAYKAVIIYDEDQMSAEASDKLVQLAEQGLPIVIVGEAPSEAVGSIGTAKVKANMAKLTSGSFDNVKQFDTYSFTPQALIRAGIVPRVPLKYTSEACRNLYTMWRFEEETGTNLVYIVNQGPDNGPYSTFTFSFEKMADSTPYILDAWTGQQQSLVTFSRTDDGYLTTTMRLKSQVSVIIGFRQGRKPGQAVSSTSSNVVTVYEESTGSIIALVDDDKEATVTLEGGQVQTLGSGPAPSSFELTGWNLTIDSYEPVEEPGMNSTNTATKIRSIDVGHLQKLVPWTQIDDLYNISGVGTYSTNFDWPEHREDMAVHLSFGQIINTLRAWVNGKLVPPVDVADAHADITNMIGPGSNEIVIEVASTLFNAVKARRDDIHCLGESPGTVTAFDGDWRPFGLLGPVVVSPMRKIVVS